MGSPPDPKLLRSWKEISTHLGVDERTCARWEQRFNMPVHRAAEAAGRSHVFAYADELDAWFRETFPTSNGNSEAAGDRHFKKEARQRIPRYAGRIIAIAGLILVSASLAFLAFRGGWPFTKVPAQPADFHIRGSMLIIVDVDGKELWRRDIGVDGLLEEAKYRLCFQTGPKDPPGRDLPWLAIKDIDGDGNKEVLFAIKRTTGSFGEGTLVCFDSRGKERWRFAAGRPLTCRGRSFSRDYRIHGFSLEDSNKDGRQEIFVIALQFPFEPCQMAVLDCRGNMTGEFWNAGHLTDIAFADIDADGREELLTTGVNNEYTGGCLAVFDPDDVSGTSPQGEKYRFEGLPEGSDRYYIDFPRSDVSWAMSNVNVVIGNTSLEVLSDGHVRANAPPGLMYDFGAGMHCLTVDYGHSFKIKHDEFVAQGKVKSVLDGAYFEALRKSLRYWNGTAWTHEPSMNLKRGAADKQADNHHAVGWERVARCDADDVAGDQDVW